MEGKLHRMYLWGIQWTPVAMRGLRYLIDISYKIVNPVQCIFWGDIIHHLGFIYIYIYINTFWILNLFPS